MNYGSAIRQSRLKNILTACRNFYANLYTAENVDLKYQDWLLDQLDTALTSEDQEKCEGSLAR